MNRVLSKSGFDKLIEFNDLTSCNSIPFKFKRQRIMNVESLSFSLILRKELLFTKTKDVMK